MKKEIFCLILLTAFIERANGIVDTRNFFPYGIDNGDTYLTPGDDTSSPEQPLSIPFNFFNYSHTSLWVNVNGAISFLSPINTFTPTCQPVSRDFRMVSPFWADVDTQLEQPSPASAVSFRESTNPNDLKKAEFEVKDAFNLTSIDLTWAYIVTWNNVTFYRDDPNRQIRNTFQAVLTTNGENSFVIFFYNKIQWTSGTASGGNANGLGGTQAQVGFDAGDGINRYMLNVSCTNDVINVNQLTNMGVAGEFVFQVDSNIIHTPPPITRPTRPTLPSTTTTSLLPSVSSDNNLDRNCGCTKEKIWLDIIAVVDKSRSMGKNGLLEVLSNLDSIVGQLNINSSPGYSTRVALITFASNATMVASYGDISDMNTFEDKLFSINVANSDDVNILSGLQMANNLLNTSSVTNRRTVVILYASAYDDTGFNNPLLIALNMRASDVKLITVAFSQKMGSGEVKKLGELAWPGFDFDSDQKDLGDKMFDALCQSNCYCRKSWLQYTKNIKDKFIPGYGVCLFFSSISSVWTAASHTCANQVPGGYLATESTMQKHDFNLAYAQNSSYHIGLQYQNGQYYWQQFNSSQSVPLNPTFTFWNPGYPNQNIGECVKVDKVFGQSYKWTNVNCRRSLLNYMCEVTACDTDNYCPPI